MISYFEPLLLADDYDLSPDVDLPVPPAPWPALPGQHSSYKETLLPPRKGEGGCHQHLLGGEQVGGKITEY